MIGARVTAVALGAAALAAALVGAATPEASADGGSAALATAPAGARGTAKFAMPSADGGASASLETRSAAAAGSPTIAQLVVFRDGKATTKRVAARSAEARIGRRPCVAGAGTALAALLRSHVGAVGLRDFGSCSTRPRDSAGLFVRSIRGERNRGVNGWVYKVGFRGASAGAADPSGPFGAGRLRSGARVTWFYCLVGSDGCQRTLSVTTTPEAGGLLVRVTGYDDRGAGVPVDAATVHVGAATATTGPDGVAHVATVPRGTRVWAEKDGMVRSFSESVS